MDHDGYGHSGSSGNNSDVASSVADLKAALPILRRETGRSKFHFYGTSSGAIRAAALAQAQPEAVDRLVLRRLHLQRHRLADQPPATAQSRWSSIGPTLAVPAIGP